METPKEKKEDIIGSGLFGIVKRETDNQNKSNIIRVAQKVINIKEIDNKINHPQEVIVKIKKRILMMNNLVKKNVQNCNITKYNDDISVNDDKLSFKMELCNCNILEYINENCPKEGSGLDIGQIYDILVQLNKAFHNLEFENINHGNLKLENILVNFDKNKYTFKLTGFEIIPELINLTKVDSPDKICMYLPPEILKENDKNTFALDQKSDLWSLGIIIYYLYFREFPYKGDTCKSILAQIDNNNKKKTNFIELDSLIDGLLNINKQQRFTWNEYFNHPFFTNNSFWKKYIIVDKIGRGQFSTVYKAKNKKDRTAAAIKIIEFSKIIKLDKHKKILNNIIKELKERIETMSNLFKENHQYFVEIYEEFYSENDIAIAMELCECNLRKHISRNSDPTDKDIFYFLVEINKAFKFLQSKNIIIENLKLENILLKEQKNTNNYIYKITDIGLCSNLFNLIKSSSSTNENICYISPELLKDETNYTYICDLWRLGIIIYYFRFKNFPYDFNSNIKIINQINSVRNNIKKCENDKFNSLIEGLLEKEPKKRLNWNEYFHHDFFINRDYSKYYELSEKSLGGESCYSIYTAKEKRTKLEKIIKIFNKEEIRNICRTGNSNENDIKQFTKLLVEQTKIMKLLEQNENKNTVEFFEYFNTKKEFAIVMEKCDTDLKHAFIRRKKNFSLEEIKEILIQLNNTFRVMEDNQIIHGDLKLENILIKKEKSGKLIYKLTDYGVSNEFLKLNKKLMGWGASPKYSAPEILSHKDFTLSSDLWSLGIILYVLYFRKWPYDGNTSEEVLESIKSKGQNELNQLSDDPQFDNLIRRLLTAEPKDRITWKNYFEHPFLEKGNCWKFYENKQFIAMGQYYKVYKVKSKTSGEYKAIKVINLNQIRTLFEGKFLRPCTKEDLKVYIDDFIDEIKSSELRRGPNKENINTLIYEQYFQTDDEFCIVEELCDGDFLQLKEKKGKFTVKEIYQIFIQLNNTFKIIQENNQSVRDLRLEEILYKKNETEDGYVYKISNFEKDKKIIELLKSSGSITSDKYKAPEILENDIQKKKMTPEELNVLYQKAYLWNLGIIIFMLYFGEFPYEGNSPKEILSNIKKNEQSLFNEISDFDLKNLLKKLLTEDKDDRIDWNGYFNHTFFSEEKWKQL